jgi:AcrR family transcriptional regulator
MEATKMRRKAPEQTRGRLLEAATRIIMTRGAMHLTLDLVAEEAAVSKGGLLHHFPTKEKLIIGLMHHTFMAFTKRLQRHRAADPNPGAGQWLRAYVRATFETAPEEEALTKALMVLAANTPAIEEAKKAALDTFFAQMELDGIDPARAWAVRLACDGLWFTELYDSLHLDEALRTRLEAELLRLTE